MKGDDALEPIVNKGKSKYYHEILVRGVDFETCTEKMLHFFEKYQLVRYSHINLLQNNCVSASMPEFRTKIEQAIHKNHQILNELVEELHKEGIVTLKDLRELQQGYKTKMLHTITHFLDGFFGIDTYFYNLEEDSHWISEGLQRRIQEKPSLYWILAVEADFD